MRLGGGGVATMGEGGLLWGVDIFMWHSATVAQGVTEQQHCLYKSVDNGQELSFVQALTLSLKSF